MKSIKIAVVAIAFLPFVSMALAQTTGTVSGTEPAGQAVRETQAAKTIRQDAARNIKDDRGILVQTNQAERQGFKAEAEALRQNLQDRLNTIKTDSALTPEAKQEAITQAREEARANLKTQAETVKQTITQNREEFKTKLQATREEVKQKIDAERRELKTRLQAVRDENKKKIVENVAEQIQKVNTNYLNRLTIVLNNLEEILRNIVSRADKAELAGRDVTQVRADIAEAETLIAAVRGYIAQQAGTTYPITVTDETTLGANASDARNRLHADLTIIKSEIAKVHEAIKKAATGLAKIPKVNDEVGADNQQ